MTVRTCQPFSPPVQEFEEDCPFQISYLQETLSKTVLPTRYDTTRTAITQIHTGIPEST
jgi:hypothetical protein